MIKLVLSLFAFMLFSLHLPSQEIWSLEKCVLHAQEQSLAVKNSLLNMTRSEIDERQAKHSRFPTLSANGSYGTNWGRAIDPSTNDFVNQSFSYNSYSLSGGVMLFNGNSINNTIKQARLIRTASLEDAEQIKNDIALSVAIAYLNVIFSQENLNNAEVQRELTRQQLERIQKLIDAGVNPASDRLEFEAQLALDEQNLINVTNSLDIALLDLKQLLYMEPEQELILEQPDLNRIMVEEVGTLDQSFGEVYAKALESQPSIRAGKLREKSAYLGEKIAQSSLFPSLSVGGSLSTNYSSQGIRLVSSTPGFDDVPVLIDQEPAILSFPSVNNEFEDNPYFDQLDENFGYGFGFNMSIPIYNNLSNSSRIQHARITSEQTKLNNDETKQQLKSAVQRAITDARAAKKSFEASTLTLAASKAAYDNVSKKLELGSASTFDFTTAKNNVTTAETNALISQFDYIFKLKVIDYYLGKPILL